MSDGRSLTSLVRQFDGLRVLTLGDAILDGYLRGSATRLCREAPAPVLALADATYAPGGAANTAHNIQRLGGTAVFAAAIGDDEDGHTLDRLLMTAGVETRLVAAPGRQTLCKQRLMADGQLLLRLDRGSTDPLSGAAEAQLLECLADSFGDADALLISDYAYGTVTDRVLELLERLQQDAPRVVVVDARSLSRYRALAPTAVKPNYLEAASLLSLPPVAAGARIVQLEPHAEQLLEATGARLCAVTLDADGAVLFERGRPAFRRYARPSPTVRSTGAGDTFAAALTLGLAAGAEASTALELASAAAQAVVDREGTVPCTADELGEQLVGRRKLLDNRLALDGLIDTYRRRGRIIVFTNGCFDLLHAGHVALLNRARAFGDVLVVGLNDDESVRRLKGAARPINALVDRAEVLMALSCVDLVVPFHEDTPRELIELIRPDVFVKGADYTRASLPEAQLVETLGGRIELLPLVENRSTTTLIQRIRDRRVAWRSWDAQGTAAS